MKLHTLQSRVWPTSFLVVDNQQARPSRVLTFTLTLMKYFNPQSVAPATGVESQHNISGLSSFFRNLQSVMSYQQIDTSRFYPPTRNIKNISSKEPSLSLLRSQLTPNSSSSRTTEPVYNRSFSGPLLSNS